MVSKIEQLDSEYQDLVAARKQREAESAEQKEARQHRWMRGVLRALGYEVADDWAGTKYPVGDFTLSLELDGSGRTLFAISKWVPGYTEEDAALCASTSYSYRDDRFMPCVRGRVVIDMGYPRMHVDGYPAGSLESKAFIDAGVSLEDKAARAIVVIMDALKNYAIAVEEANVKAIAQARSEAEENAKRGRLREMGEDCYERLPQVVSTSAITVNGLLAKASRLMETEGWEWNYQIQFVEGEYIAVLTKPEIGPFLSCFENAVMARIEEGVGEDGSY
jgi:hypothetical protein